MGIEEGLNEAESAYHERNKELGEQLWQNELLKERERIGTMHGIEFSPPHLSNSYQSPGSDEDENNFQIQSQDCCQQLDDDTLCKQTYSQNEYHPT